MYPILFKLPEWFPLLGGQPITTFGVFMLFAFLTAGYILRGELRRKGHDPEKAWDMVFMAVIGGILGAKLYYMLLNFDRLVADPMTLILARGGLVWYGGFALASALVLWEVHRSKLPMGQAVDASAPALALAYAVGRIGCFLVGDDYGKPTDLPWGIAFPKGSPPTTVPVHPTQLYEVLASLVIFALLLWVFSPRFKREGPLIFVYAILAGIERFLVEFVRTNEPVALGLTQQQWISIALVIVGIAGTWWFGTRGRLRPAFAGAAAAGKPKAAVSEKPKQGEQAP